MQDVNRILQGHIPKIHLDRLMALNNPKLHAFVADAIELAKPSDVYVCTDDPKDFEYIKQLSLKNGEEKPLKTKNHSIHFDGINDQGRDTFSTRYLLPQGSSLGASLKSVEKVAGTAEVRGFLKDSMVGRQMIIAFFCLGPIDSEFSISCAQITDSPYVIHAESILYRKGYEQFKKLGSSPDFFRFFHSEGELENFVSKQHANRRVYIDLEEEMVYSANTQYAGNTVGLKKLALRLALQKASREGWLAEHMFVMGVNGPKNRVTYFTGAFPSACGKTSTSMLSGQTIVGDDIAYLRKRNNQMYCVNVEKGIFGIIDGISAKGDPVIYKALTSPLEVIFSNVLVGKDNNPYWTGMGVDVPTEGVNFSGEWTNGKKDAEGNEIPCSHKNARYCLNIPDLDNCDPRIDDKNGVPVGGVIYGGRDSDTWVPVEQAFNWTEGIIAKGASIESETTAATIGKTGIRTFNLMANIDFVSIPLGKYIQINLDFAKGVSNPPPIFSVNYFLRGKDAKFLNGIADKKVWILWAELKAHGDVGGLKTPTGIIPKYEDIAPIFKKELGKDYTKEDYINQFTIRIPENLAKIDRVEAVYKEKVTDTPKIVYETFNLLRSRLKEAQAKYGDNIDPFKLPVA